MQLSEASLILFELTAALKIMGVKMLTISNAKYFVPGFSVEGCFSSSLSHTFLADVKIICLFYWQ